MNHIKDNVERHAFGVCSYLGRKMGLQSSKVRMYFIYTSFLTLGSPIIIYLVIAFWMNIKNYFKRDKAWILD